MASVAAMVQRAWIVLVCRMALTNSMAVASATRIKITTVLRTVVVRGVEIHHWMSAEYAMGTVYLASYRHILLMLKRMYQVR